jgi:ligand-binding sensor domain-containing protein
MKQFLTFFFLLSISCAYSQQYSFIRYSIEDGVPHTQVEALFQDNKGYLWVGTIGGVGRFDGQKFMNYSTQNGLLDNQINTIIQDSKNRIWLGTLGGLMLYDNGEFKNFEFGDDLKSNNVLSIFEDANGVFWLGTDGAGLVKFDGETFQIYSTLNGLSNNYVRSILQDKNGRLLLGTRSGVNIFSDGKFELMTQFGLDSLNVSQLKRDENGRLWVLTYGNGVMILDNDTAINLTEEQGLISNWIREMEVEDEHTFWLASKFGIGKVEINSGKYSIKNFTTKQGMPSHNIRSLMIDVDNNLWLGTDGAGVLRFTGESFVNITKEDGLSSDIVMSIIEDNDKNLWFSTYGAGITEYVGGEYKYLSIAAGLTNSTVWTSSIDKEGKLWFGTSDGVTVFDGKHVKRYYTKHGLAGNRITYIYNDASNKIWLGTKNGVSIFENNTFSSIKVGKGKMGRNVRAIYQQHNGDYWFGTSDGVFRFHNDKTTQYTTEQGLTDNTVYCIAEDKSNRLWMGTKNGITLFDGKDLKQIEVNQDYNSNFINSLIIDKQANLWVGTNNGIYKANITDYDKTGVINFNQFGLAEGIKSLETNLNAAYQDSKGYLWFGTSAGVVRYDPSQLSKENSLKQPYTHITNVRLFLEDVNWKKYSKSIDVETGLPNQLSVPFNKNYYTFDYIGICLGNPEKVLYKFKLEGFDEDWSPPTKASFATYSNLPHGQYVFKVIASNTNKYNEENAATFSFEIRPPFWRTWWFYGLCVVISGCIMLLLFIWRKKVRFNREEKQMLEYKSKMLLLERQTLNASMNRHFVFNALNSIQYYINTKDQRSANKYLSDFAKLIRLNLDSAQNELIPLSDEIQRLHLYLSLEYMRFEDKFDYTINVNKDIPSSEIMIPAMLVQPFVENSIMHGILPTHKKGSLTVDIKLSEDENEVLIYIFDDGVGVETSMKNKRTNDMDAHASQGMGITKGRIDLIRQTNTRYNISIIGPYEVKSNAGDTEGTKVEIIIPVDSNLFQISP